MPGPTMIDEQECQPTAAWPHIYDCLIVAIEVGQLAKDIPENRRFLAFTVGIGKSDLFMRRERRIACELLEFFVRHVKVVQDGVILRALQCTAHSASGNEISVSPLGSETIRAPDMHAQVEHIRPEIAIEVHRKIDPGSEVERSTESHSFA